MSLFFFIVFTSIIFCKILSSFAGYSNPYINPKVSTGIFNQDGTTNIFYWEIVGTIQVVNGTKNVNLGKSFTGINTYNCLVEDMIENKIARYTRTSTNTFTINIYLNTGIFDPTSNGTINFVCIGY